MNMEMIAARSILSMASKFRADYLHNFYELGRKNLELPLNKGDTIAYLIPAGQARDEAVAKMIGSLIDQGVEVFRLDQELHVVLSPQSVATNESASARNLARTKSPAH